MFELGKIDSSTSFSKGFMRVGYSSKVVLGWGSIYFRITGMIRLDLINTILLPQGKIPTLIKMLWRYSEMKLFNVHRNTCTFEIFDLIRKGPNS
jgi:hypothetical protein